MRSWLRRARVLEGDSRPTIASSGITSARALWTVEELSGSSAGISCGPGFGAGDEDGVRGGVESLGERPHRLGVGGGAGGHPALDRSARVGLVDLGVPV